MTETIEIDIQEKDRDAESGDMYYKVDATLMEPGALFGENEEDIEEKLREALNNLK